MDVSLGNFCHVRTGGCVVLCRQTESLGLASAALRIALSPVVLLAFALPSVLSPKAAKVGTVRIDFPYVVYYDKHPYSGV